MTQRQTPSDQARSAPMRQASDRERRLPRHPGPQTQPVPNARSCRDEEVCPAALRTQNRPIRVRRAMLAEPTPRCAKSALGVFLAAEVSS